MSFKNEIIWDFLCGWQIIGRTPLKIFDKDPAILSKFKMGDFVKFYPITRAEFESLNQNEL